MLGKEMIYDRSLTGAERKYIRLFGVPINGLRIRARRILPLIDGPYRQVMDAGCGQGVFTFEIARRLPASAVVGIDIDDFLLRRNRVILKKIGLTNCRFEHQDMMDLPYTEAFDLICSVDNLEHIEDDERAIANLHTALKPGGRLILHVPGDRRRWFFFRWRTNFDVEGHYRPGYSRKDIVGKLENAGFNICESSYTYGWLETITNNISYLITGAAMRRKHLYALVFPLLLLISWFGRNSRPSKGAGVRVIAER